MARSIASFVGTGGGLLDRSVTDFGGASYCGYTGEADLARRSRSMVSAAFNVNVRADEGRICSLAERSGWTRKLDQSPEVGLPSKPGDVDKGVSASVIG